MKLDKKGMIVVGLLILFILVLLMNYQFAIVERDISQGALLAIEIGVILLGILLIFVSVHICYQKDFQPEKAILYIAPIFCIIFSMITPVGRGHDEYMHWLKAYEVSEGTLYTSIYEGKSLVNVPKAMLNIIVERPDAIFKYADNIKVLDEKIDENERVYRNNHNAATYCFVQYIPQAIGITFGRMITKVPLLISYFGRTFNMLTCVVLMYFAIKNIPFGKNILLVLSIIPITIEGFATLSADGITIAIACFFTAYAFKMIFDKDQKCATKQITILTIAGAILALCKFVYLPLVFLVLLIPKEKFKDRKEKVTTVTFIILVAVILNLAWLYFGSSALVATSPEGTSAKFMQILSNPLTYIQKIMYTVTHNFNNYFLSSFGGQLEWDEKVQMDIVPYIMFGLIILATINESKLKNVFTKKHIRVIFFIIMAIVGLIFTSIFLQWTKSEIEINGVQGRYFIPILPLILCLIGKHKIQASYQYQNVTKAICIVGYIVMIYTAISIMAIHI